MSVPVTLPSPIQNPIRVEIGESAEELLVKEVASGAFRRPRTPTPTPIPLTPTPKTKAGTPDRRKNQLRRAADRVAYRAPWRAFLIGAVSAYALLGALGGGAYGALKIGRPDLWKNWPVMRAQLTDYVSSPTPPAPGDFLWTDEKENTRMSGLISRDGRKWIRPGANIQITCWDRWTEKSFKTTLLCRGETACEVSCGLFASEEL